MAEAAGIGAVDRRQPAIAVLTRAAGIAWPVLAVLLAALAMAAVTMDHGRLVRVDQAIIPEGWKAADFRSALARLGFSPSGYAITLDVAKASVVAAFFVVAAVAWQRRRVDAGALMAAYFLVAFAANWEVEPSRMPAWAGPWLSAVDFLAWTAFLNFFLLFPDNRYRPRWTRWLAAGIPATALATTVAGLGGPVQVIAFGAMLLLAVGAQVLRYRRHSNATQRQQARWLLVGFGTTAGLMVALLAIGAALHPAPPSQGALLLEVAGQAIGQLAFLPIPVAIAIATTRHRLWEMDRVVNRALVYGALTAGLGLVYVGVAFIAGARLSGPSGPAASILGAIAVALLLQPARARVQLALNRAMYGLREDPYSAISQLGRRLTDSLAPDEVLPLVAATVRNALRSPLVEITVPGETAMSVSSGDVSARARAQTIAISHQGVRVGELLVAPRAGDSRLGDADLRLISDLAFHAGSAIHDLNLRHQLLASRESLVVTREEERRRLSRVLHDDLGATLAAQKLKAGSIRAAVRTEPAVAERGLEGLESDLATAIRQLRELSYELRPPALEDLGLLEALRALLQHRQAEGVATSLTTEADPLPPLRAAAELSIYRIVEQALANTIRHAGASNVVVEIRTPKGAVEVEVHDDGRGMPPGARAGVGMNSMRERAEELGGSFKVEGRRGGGTRVVARIPLVPGG